MGDEEIEDFPNYWMADEPDELLAISEKKRKKTKPKKMEFVGWGSRPLIDFLKSISKDVSKQIPHFDVASIVNDYVKANNLIHPHKKKRIMCDDRLFSLFGKKSLPRIKVHDFLEKHFAENQSDSDSDFLYSSDENEERARKKQKAAMNPKDIKKKIKESPKSCFAAIIPANVKLLYLKKKLVQDLHKDEDLFERKLVGSFVRVKSNPNDYLQKNSHQLLQVTGVKRPFGAAATCSDILLEVANRIDDIRICMLSDDNFSEEECEDLRERIKSGSLKRPLTVEFQEKAELLHEDITKHWLDRELYLLQNLIDRANEKGWRKELFEYLERKQLLESPEEQKRMLLEVPKVISEELENVAEMKEDTNDSPTSILMGPSVISADNSESSQNLATQEIDINKVPEDQEIQVAETQKVAHIIEIVKIEKKEGVEASSANPQQQKKLDTKFLSTTQVIELSDDDDDEKEEESAKLNSIKSNSNYKNGMLWHYVDPQGKEQGPFSLETLKCWSDAKYFPKDFKVFQKMEERNPVLLCQLLVPDYL